MRAKMDLTDLVFFVRVAERESFSAAARELGVPTSTVSRGVARLEDALGVRLLERTTRKVVSTAAGRALLGSVSGPLGQVSRAAEDIAAFHDKPCGHVRITAPAGIAPELARLLVLFRKEHPEVTVEAILTNRYVDLVAEGVDIALRGGVLTDSSLIAKKIGESSQRLYASPAYLARRPPLRVPADLAKHDTVLVRAKRSEGKLSLERGAKRVSVTVRSPVSGDDFLFVRTAVVEGAGVGLMPEGLAVDDVVAGILTHVLPEWEVRGASMSLVIPSAKHLPTRVLALRDFLAAELTIPAGESLTAHVAKRTRSC